ncbi:MAG: glucose-1-phosphate adenylyltransferase [Candidatus Omnitrophota bacterium]|nr:glucose-1-phosphate adenylyltransferase [Candidatus Omnitrophota bacterium]
MSEQITTLILGGGQGKRLFPLTSYRSKPAVPIGAKYRLVDIPISNSINSGLRQIFVLTQFNSVSLHRHIHRAYAYGPFNQTSIELLAAEQTPVTTDWFQGTADAVRKHLDHYHLKSADTVVILSGDHLYRMDYRKILDFHYKKNADVTISTVPVTKRDVSGFGILQLRSNGRVSAFLEKPAKNVEIGDYVIPGNIRKAYHVRGAKELYLASMGVYVFKAGVLASLLAGKETDFGREIIPKSIKQCQAYGYVFNGYWRDIGTIRSFYETSIELTCTDPPFNFMAPEGRIFTRARFLPPSTMTESNFSSVLMGEGCVIKGADISQSLVGVRSVIDEGTSIRKSVLMGNDFYETGKSRGKPQLGIGKKCVIENCILDKNVRIGDRVRITNQKRVQEKDGNNYYIRDGIVIVPKGAVIASGTRI